MLIKNSTPSLHLMTISNRNHYLRSIKIILKKYSYYLSGIDSLKFRVALFVAHNILLAYLVI